MSTDTSVQQNVQTFAHEWLYQFANFVAIRYYNARSALPSNDVLLTSMENVLLGNPKEYVTNQFGLTVYSKVHLDASNMILGDDVVQMIAGFVIEESDPDDLIGLDLSYFTPQGDDQ